VLTGTGFREAAVLVPLVDRGGDPALTFIVRPTDMPTHPGQIAFPGGGRDPGDPDAFATALREAGEELGIPAESVEVLGALDDTATPLGYVITPVVGWIASPPVFTPAPREVASWFEVPVGALSAPGCFADRGPREVGGRRYELFEYRVGDRLIWGATARIVCSLLEVASGHG
jgi:8-oxo-dGTP pyrophosphatase MutT (NUDIX family)